MHIISSWRFPFDFRTLAALSCARWLPPMQKPMLLPPPPFVGYPATGCGVPFPSYLFLFFTTTPSRDPFLSLKNRVSFRFSDSCSHNKIIVFGSTHTFGSPCRDGNNENGVFRARRRRTTDIRDACPSTFNRYVPLNVFWYLQYDTLFTHANDHHCRRMFHAECSPTCMTCIVVWAVFPDRLWLTLHEVIDYLPPFARLPIPRPLNHAKIKTFTHRVEPSFNMLSRFNDMARMYKRTLLEYYYF